MKTLAHPDAEELSKFFTRFEDLTGFMPLSTEAQRHCQALIDGKLIVVTQNGPVVTVNTLEGKYDH